MRTERPLFFRNANACQFTFDTFRELLQAGFCFNACPEDARGVDCRKKSNPAESDLKRLGFDGTESLFDLLHDRVRLLPDKLQRYMQRLRADPARIGCKPAHLFDEMLKASS